MLSFDLETQTKDITFGELTLAIDLETQIQEISFEFNESMAGGVAPLPYYKGEYSVTPKITEQTLETKNKSMLQDVSISGIPKEETHNAYGTTLTIG